MKKFILLIALILGLSIFALSATAGTFVFSGTVKYANGTAALGANVTIYDPFNAIQGEPWSNLTDSNGFFIIEGVNDTQQATYKISMVNNYSNYASLKVGPMMPPMPASALNPAQGMPGPAGAMSLCDLNWTLGDGAVINVTAFNSTSDMPFGGEITDKRLEWPLAGWYSPTEYVSANGTLVYVPRYRNYTATLWSQQSPPRGYLINTSGLSTGIYHLRANTTTIMVNISGYLINDTDVNFTRLRAYWLIGGDSARFDDKSSLDGAWLNSAINATNGSYFHEVPSHTALVICGYANSSAQYEGCSNVTVVASDIPLNLTLRKLAGAYDNSSEPNTSKTTLSFFKKYYNGNDNVIGAMGKIYIKVKTTYEGKEIWWGMDTNTSGSVKFPIQNNSNISIKVFANDAPPRTFDYTGVNASLINITLEAMDQMVDAQGSALNNVAPTFYVSNSSCDLPDASSNCILMSFTNTTHFNPFRLMALGGNVSARLTLPSGVVLHYINVDILAGSPDMHKPSQTAAANTSRGDKSVTETWFFGSMVPREMYERVLVGVPYNTSLVSENHPFKLLITELYSIQANGSWALVWNSTDSRAENVPSYYQDFRDYPTIFNISKGGINCSTTNTSARCYVDTVNDKIWFYMDHFSGLGPQVATYATLGNITSDKTIYSCWQDSSATQGCVALVNVSVLSTSPLINMLWNFSVNNSADNVDINYKIAWWNGSAWANQTRNWTLVNGTSFNVTATTYQFRINITLPYAMSIKWNISFGINDTYYTLDPYLDSINLTNPANYNTTVNQTPVFNFTLFSNNVSIQSCNLTLNNTIYATNTTVRNGNVTVMTASRIDQGNYSWKIVCNISGESASRWIYINDISTPTITALVSPITSTGGTLTATLIENVSSCTYDVTNFATGVIVKQGALSRDSLTSWSGDISGLSSSTQYSATVYCTDLGENAGTGSYAFTTSAAGTTSTGGGGGGGAASTYTLTVDVDEGVQTFTMRTTDIVSIKLNGASHSFKVTNIYADYITFRVKSEGKYYDVRVNETKNVDMNDDGTYDLAVTLEEILSTKKVKLRMERIAEVVPETAEEAAAGEAAAETGAAAGETAAGEAAAGEGAAAEKAGKLWLWILIAVVIVALAYFLLFHKKGGGKKHHPF